MTEKLPSEVEELRELVMSLVEENSDLHQKLGKFQLRVAELTARNDELEAALEEHMQGAPRSFLEKLGLRGSEQPHPG
jgi:predicted nuclease with TOPRIM domain